MQVMHNLSSPTKPQLAFPYFRTQHTEFADLDHCFRIETPMADDLIG
jgi:hypothetical protein